ncbi:Phytocyanin domain [Dillenia turbinata]|uniref:Phytocyanin domain n=1 Tax=Dillenia turbinata TaxID=194707 RepID=A0AAN8WCZ7_9MAGN
MGKTMLLPILLIISFYFHGFQSAVYTVGDDEQWNTGVNYLKWSEKYNFTVGDTLDDVVFIYIKGQHDVHQVTQDVYQSCNASTGVLASYYSGKDTVNLTQAEKYWFICNIEGHCLGGMKLVVDVKDAVANGSTPSSPTTPSPMTYQGNGCPCQKWSIGMFFVGLGILFMMTS